MKKLPILTLAISLVWGGLYATRLIPQLVADQSLFAQETTQSDDSPKTDRKADGSDPKQLLRDAQNSLIEHQPFRANVVETVALNSRKFRLTGTYIQGRDLKLRLEFQVQVGDLTGTLLEVCNGQVLWTRQQVFESDSASTPTAGRPITFTRRDVGQILKAAANSASTPENFLVAELGLGGLSALLASLEQKIDFEGVTTEQIDGRDFRVIEGGWKESFAQAWKQSNPNDQSVLPAFIPDRVRVYFDAETLFPRRVLYLKQNANGSGHRPMVTLDFNDVVFNVAVDEKLFDYVPPDGITPDDITEQYLKQLQPASASGSAGQ